jgi:5' nucleotidase, deoxy (Pyrimidine), cytosolic type C protein (NT5C)
MKITELETQKHKIVYVDMDGVLADLFNHVAELQGVDHYHHMTADDWNKFFKDSDAEHLFTGLPMFPTANKLLSMVRGMAGGYKILSSPLSFDKEGSIRGKRTWLHKHITVLSDGVIFEHEKQKYAKQPNGTPNILIDDYGVNINKWNAAGGIGIKYQADEDSLDYLQNELARALASR